MPVRIGELLLKEKRITPAQLQEALNYQKAHEGKLGFNLVKLGYVKDEESRVSSASSTAFPPSISRSSTSILRSSSWFQPTRRKSTRSCRSVGPV